jgi:BirA family biotin operon repressor/biotin-[acetyl-CoA-carboxylase] ligase
MTFPPGYTLLSLPEVESTNDEAARRLKSGEAAMRTVVTATSQTKGRGRYGRDWVSDEGNLFASILLKPPGVSFSWAQLGFVASLSIAEGLKKILHDKKVQLKWPNDVLVEDKKIAGILLEIKPNPKNEDALILGFGVNCVSHPDNAAVMATDLKEQEVEQTEPAKVLEVIMNVFSGYYELWLEKGFPAIREPWLAHAKDLKKEITVRHGNSEIKGEFVDIGSDDGALYIKQQDEEPIRIAAGDVYFGQ